MAVRPILRYPHASLRLAAAPVERFDAGLRQLGEDLVETMREAQGLGITAPHIGVMQRLMVVQLAAEEPAQFYVNPQILEASAELRRDKEGSVSMPDVLEEIERPARIKIAFQDLDGTKHVADADGLLATCLQHEIDQLDGIFWIDKLSRLRRERVVKRYEKIQRLTKAASA